MADLFATRPGQVLSADHAGGCDAHPLRAPVGYLPPQEEQHRPGTRESAALTEKDGNGGFLPNPGYCPVEAAGKRVRVRLAHGGIGTCDDNPMSPPGWAADGRQVCNWMRTGSRFDIAEYQVIR